jgi:iron complex outermembrane receptor protein
MRKCRLTRLHLLGCLSGTFALTAFLSTAMAANDPGTIRNLSALSLEELTNIEVTSVSRRAERLSDAPASVYVITNEDIRRSGATGLAEALRLAPNLQVARVNTGQYAISARGFNNGIGNKLLVLIDGRTVYTPLFSTVNWDSQYVMLEDVERIEVISGPGATLWGANAVNGVINVITRSAQSTQGALAAVGAGNRENSAAARYGGKLGPDGYYRVYGMGGNRENSVRANGSAVPDGWSNAQGGFRADWGNTSRGFTLQGDIYQGKEEPGPLGSP